MLKIVENITRTWDRSIEPILKILVNITRAWDRNKIFELFDSNTTINIFNIHIPFFS